LTIIRHIIKSKAGVNILPITSIALLSLRQKYNVAAKKTRLETIIFTLLPKIGTTVIS